jgi:hypothetical protein
VRNEEKSVCSAPTCCDTECGPPVSGKIIKEMPDSVASGTPYILFYAENSSCDAENISFVASLVVYI